MNLSRKITTRPIHLWERKRPYPIRERIFTLPPLPIVQKDKISIIIQTTSANILDASWAARSILMNLSFRAGLIFVVDGVYNNYLKNRLQISFPGAKIIHSNEVLSLFNDMPMLYKLAKSSPVGRKLLSVLHFQRYEKIIFSDSDILVFEKLNELENIISSNSQGCYIQEKDNICADAGILESAKLMGLDFSATLNSGFFYVDMNTLDIECAEKLLSLELCDLNSWFVEQTIVAVLMSKLSTDTLSRSKYVVNNQRQFYFEQDVDYSKIELRHFVSPVRHVMYLKGMPFLWNKWKYEGIIR